MHIHISQCSIENHRDRKYVKVIKFSFNIDVDIVLADVLLTNPTVVIVKWLVDTQRLTSQPR